MLGQIVGNGLIYANNGDYYRFANSDPNFKIGVNVEFDTDESDSKAVSMKVYEGSLDEEKKDGFGKIIKNFDIKEKFSSIKKPSISDLKLPNLSLKRPKTQQKAKEEIKELNIFGKEKSEPIFKTPKQTIPEYELKKSFFETPDLKTAKEAQEPKTDGSFDEIKEKIDQNKSWMNLKVRFDDDEPKIISPKEKNEQKGVSISKLLALIGVFVLIAGIVAFYLYNDKIYNIKSYYILGIAGITYLVMTYKALDIAGELSNQTDLCKNFIKSIFYPPILAFVLSFIIGLMGTFIERLVQNNQMYVMMAVIAIAIIWWIMYFISINKKVYMTLASITKVELFKVYAILFITTSLITTFFSIFIYFPQSLLFIPQNLISKLIGFALVIYFAIFVITIIMYIIYIIAWIKVKEIKRAWL